MIRLKDNAYRGYSLCKMQESDFVFVKTFLDTQRSRLDRIEFFYPYKDEELLAVLANGCFWGLFDGAKLIATFAIDFDEEYAITLANLINSFNDIGIERAYESSGLMVAQEYRGQGIAKYMMKLACDEADRRRIAICGVVHTQNVASMSTFFALGFEMRATWHMSDGYDFIYLLKRFDKVCSDNDGINFQKVLQLEANYAKIKNVIGVTNTHTKEQNALLSDGYVGIGCQDTKIYFRKKE
ncbi:MAG: GNAT family N-acetyltransferase [Clostridia bacterium]|nr:GNAT family N-acetyltransferase [Clostridia bacterium]